MGPSEDVQHGHTGRFPDDTFVTSRHLKQNSVDSDKLIDLEPQEIEVPVPERRVRGKTASAKLFGRHPLSVEEKQAETEAKRLWNVGDWSIGGALGLYDYLKTIRAKHTSGRAVAQEGSSS